MENFSLLWWKKVMNAWCDPILTLVLQQKECNANTSKPYLNPHPGGMKASSGIALPELGDKNDDMYIAVAVITLGYWRN